MFQFIRKSTIFFILLTTLIPTSNLLGASLDYIDDLPPLIERDLFFGDPKIAGAQISQDGKYLSFLKPYQGVRNIYVKKRDEPFEKARPITADDRAVSGYFWTQDSRYILYVQDKEGEENFHIYAVDPSSKPEEDTGVPPAKDLTPIEGVRARIYFVPENTPDTIIVGLNDRDASYHDVHKISISSGNRKLICKNTQKMAGYTFDQEGNLRLASRETEDGGTEILRFTGEGFERIYKCGFEETSYPIRFDKEGKKVYFVTNKGENVDLTRLTLMNPKTGKTELVEYDPEKEADFAGAFFDLKTDELIATFYLGDRVRIYPKTEEFKKDLEYLREELPNGEISFRSATENMDFFLIGVSRDVDPGSVYLYDRKNKKIDFLYKSRPELNSKHLAYMKPLRYKARDGMEIPAYLTLPKGVRHKNLPVVMMVHGGPWGRDWWGYDPYTQFFANRGYAVFQPNFRGSAGYGKKFLNAGNKQWGTGYMQHDVSDGAKYLIEEGYADPAKVAIFGISYGGYATLAGLTFTPELYSAGISYCGPSNLLTLLNSIPPYWEPMKKMLYKRVGDPDIEEEKKQLKAQSPLFSVENIDDPLLVIQGANDPRVKREEADQIVVASREKGLDVDYLVAPDEGHGFRQLNNRLVVAAAMEKFFTKHLNGRYQKEVSDSIQKRWDELKVNIDSVKMPDTLFVKGEAKADFPDIDASKLKPYSADYKQVLSSRGNEVNLDFTREFREAKLNGEKIWLLISTQKTPMGSSVDSLYLNIKDCSPVKRIIHQGMAEIVLNYTDEQISGSMQMGPRQNDIEVALDSKILVAPEVLSIAMDITPDFKAQFGTFDIMKQQVRQYLAEVIGQEKIEVPAGSFNSYRIEVSPVDGDEGKQTLFLSVKKPHVVLKSISEILSMMGGGTITSELKSTDLTE